MRRLVLILTVLLFVIGCPQKGNESLPDVKKYETDGLLMLNICKKFSEETDAQKLHKAAAAVQASRVIGCFNYNEECSLYGQCLATVIKTSEDGHISPSEREEMRQIHKDLKNAIDIGKAKLQTEWSKRQRQ